MFNPSIDCDPKNRSVNNPVMLLSPKQALQWYHEITNTTGAKSVDNVVKEGVIRHARHIGWSKVSFVGQQCLLIAIFGETDV